MIKHSNSRRDTQPIDVERVVKYLTYKFSAVNEGVTDNSRGTPAYNRQVEFTYILNDIQKAPSYSVGKHITRANTFLAEISESTVDRTAA